MDKTSSALPGELRRLHTAVDTILGVIITAWGAAWQNVTGLPVEPEFLRRGKTFLERLRQAVALGEQASFAARTALVRPDGFTLLGIRGTCAIDAVFALGRRVLGRVLDSTDSKSRLRQVRETIGEDLSDDERAAALLIAAMARFARDFPWGLSALEAARKEAEIEWLRAAARVKGGGQWQLDRPHDTTGAGHGDQTDGSASQGAKTTGTDKGGQADGKTDNPRKKMPNNPDVRDLCHALARNIVKDRSQIKIAREFTRNNEKKARNLLRQARRYRHLWDLADT